jgi:hypothetical protein
VVGGPGPIHEASNERLPKARFGLGRTALVLKRNQAGKKPAAPRRDFVRIA